MVEKLRLCTVRFPYVTKFSGGQTGERERWQRTYSPGGRQSSPLDHHLTTSYLPGKNSPAIFSPITAQLAPSETVPSRPRTLPSVLGVTNSSLIIQTAHWLLQPVPFSTCGSCPSPFNLASSFSHEALGERVLNKRGLYSELASLP